MDKKEKIGFSLKNINLYMQDRIQGDKMSYITYNVYIKKYVSNKIYFKEKKKKKIFFSKIIYNPWNQCESKKFCSQISNHVA